MKYSLKTLFAALFATVFLTALAGSADAAWSYQWFIEPNPAYRSLDPVSENLAIFYGGESFFYKRGIVRLSDKKEIVPAEYDDIRALAGPVILPLARHQARQDPRSRQMERLRHRRHGRCSAKIHLWLYHARRQISRCPKHRPQIWCDRLCRKRRSAVRVRLFNAETFSANGFHLIRNA